MASTTLPKGGVYVITNNVDDRVYVGSSINLKSRLKTHRNFLLSGRHNHLFQSFWDAHEGKVELSFKVLEAFADDLDKPQRRAREQFWLDHYRSYEPERGFNIHPNAIGARGMTQTPEWVAKRVAKQIGLKRSPEVCERMRVISTGRKFSEESKQKRREKMLGVAQHDKRLLTFEIAEQIRALCASGVSQQGAADRFGISRGMVRDILARRTYANP